MGEEVGGPLPAAPLLPPRVLNIGPRGEQVQRGAPQGPAPRFSGAVLTG